MAQFHVVDIAGTARERGHAHGEGLRDVVRERDRRWRAALEATTKLPAATVIGRFLAETDFVPAIERHTPDPLDEVRGIAEGAGLPYDAVLAAQFMDEEWWFTDALAGTHHCSSLGTLDPGAGRAVVAQTMDLVTWTDGFQTILRLRGARPEQDAVILTMAGMIGLCGMTAAGLGVCINTLAQLASRRDGLPVAFVTRGALACATAADAARFVRAVPHASGQNYVIGDGRDLYDLEASANGVATHAESAGRGLVVRHTNHPLTSKDLGPAPYDPASARERHTARRLASLVARLPDGGGTTGVATASAALAAQDDPEFPVAIPATWAGAKGRSYFTFATVVWELMPAPVAHMAPGALTEHRLEALPVGRAGARAAAE
jgi:hypothetical protein